MNLMEVKPKVVIPGIQMTAKYYAAGKLTVIYDIEEGSHHVSISHPSRNPTWDEIKEIRYKLVPNEVTMAMIMPPMEQYVNIHNFCFHLWQVVDKGGMLYVK